MPCSEQGIIGLARRLAYSTATALASIVVVRLSVVIASVVLARYEGPQEFAVLIFAHNTASTLAAIGTFGVPQAVIHSAASETIADSRDSNRVRTSSLLAVGLCGLILAGVGFLLATQGLGYWMSDEILPSPLGVAVLSVLVGGMTVFMGIAIGTKANQKVIIASFAFGCLIVAGTIICAALNIKAGGLWAYLLASAVALILLSAPVANLLRRSRRSGVSIWPRINANLIQAVVATAPLGAATAIFTVGTWSLGAYAIASLNGPASFAEYATALQVFGLLCLLSTAIAKASVYEFSRLAPFASGNGDVYRHLLISSGLSCVSCVFMAALIYVFLDPLLGVYGAYARGYSSTVSLMLVAAIIQSPCDTFAAFVVSIQRHSLVLWAHVLWLAGGAGVLLGFGVENVHDLALALCVAYAAKLCFYVAAIYQSWVEKISAQLA